MDGRKRLFSQCAALIGNILEHKDKALFALLTPFIADQFFPGGDYLVSLIEMYGILVLSILVKPLGALVFGRMADQRGRKQALLLSMYGMSLATLGMGLIPTYDSIGYLAPALLFFLRSAQNFFSVAEPTNGAVYVLENCNKRWHAFASSLFEASSMLGILIASLETTLLAYFGWMQAHWQWLFIVAGAIGLLCTLWRESALESHENTTESLTLRELWDQRQMIGACSLMTAFSYSTYLFSITFINVYLKVMNTGLDTLQLTSLNTLLTLFDLVALPLFGYLALSIAPKHLMSVSTLLLGIIALPLFIWMRHFESVLVVLSVRVAIVLLGVCFAAPYRAWMQERVSSHRCTILNIGGTIGQLLAQGPITLFCLFALQEHLWLYPPLILSLLSLYTSYAVWTLSHKKSLQIN